MTRQIWPLILLLSSATAARAHFVFAVPEAGGKSARVFINEVLKPSTEVDVSIIGGAKLSVRNNDGSEMPLTLVREGAAYKMTWPGAGTVIHGTADLGFMQQGGKPFVLIYYPKTILGDAFDSRSVVGGAAPIEIVPAGKPGAMVLRVLVQGKPLGGAEINLVLPDGTQKKIKADANGESAPLTQTGRYGAWARHWEPVGGERDGKKFEETHDYATLVFDAPAVTVAKMPQASSSFGAVAADGWLYVYGGHVARTHSYSTASVSGRFDRLNLKDGKTWESLPAGKPLQGMNLATHKGKVYLVGGMEPRNKPGEPEDIHSIADVSRFDPATKQWEALAPLPQGRSSHDVVVIGDKLLVMGGWTLKGDRPTEWCDTVAIMDLAAAKPVWTSVKQPFRRRAFIAVAYAGRMYVLGGFDEKAQVVHEVSIYDPVSGAWSSGPELPAGAISSFAPAACVQGNDLYVSVADGAVYRLAGSGWVRSGAATPRIAHRMVAHDDAVLVIGGAFHGDNSDLIEGVPVSR